MCDVDVSLSIPTGTSGLCFFGDLFRLKSIKPTGDLYHMGLGGLADVGRHTEVVSDAVCV